MFNLFKPQPPNHTPKILGKPKINKVNKDIPIPKTPPQGSAIKDKGGIIENFIELDDAVRMFGSKVSEVANLNSIKSFMGVLIHDDNSATIIITVEGQANNHSKIKAIISLLHSELNITKQRTVKLITLGVLASAYEKYTEKLDKINIADLEVSSSLQSQVKNYTFQIINKALDTNASDIHIEVRKNNASIKFRKDGDIEVIENNKTGSDYNLIKSISAFLFQGDYADSDSKSNTQSSDNVIQFAFIRIAELKNVAMRYQSFLDKDGYDIILRILTYDGKSDKVFGLAEMGFEPSQIKLLTRAVSAPYGASFLGGATGSGKTTTLAGVANADPFKHIRKRYSIEDPVEIEIEGVTQYSIKRSSADLSDEPFIEALKALLRSDPDLAIVGEVREKVTAELLINAAIAGHNIWATLHINRMVDTFYRLTSPTIGISPSVLGSGNLINLINAQTLVKKLCNKCKLTIDTALEKCLIDIDTVNIYLNDFGLSKESMFIANSTNNDCPDCAGKGEYGRTVCAEMVILTPEMKVAIREERYEDIEDIYRKSRVSKFIEADMTGKTYLDHAIYKVSQGLVCANFVSSLAPNGLDIEVANRKKLGYLNKNVNEISVSDTNNVPVNDNQNDKFKDL